MPTVYRFPKTSLPPNKVTPRELELWEKNCKLKGVDPRTTPPVTQHPRKKTDK
jgi:hypothetical protein